MKFWFPTLALVATVSLPAVAQEAPPPGAMPPPSGDSAMARPSAQQMEAMQKLHEQVRQLHAQARLQMLAALTPAHRAALANIVGQLAIAPSPNRHAAEAQIDALLSSGEKNSVLTAETNARNSSRAIMESARTQFEASAPADERAKMQARDAARASERRPQSQTAMAPDAGRTLLRMASMGQEGGSGEHGMGEFGHGPMFFGRPN